jgi:hypothetical protein
MSIRCCKFPAGSRATTRLAARQVRRLHRITVIRATLPEPPSMSGTWGGPPAHPFGAGRGVGARREDGLIRSRKADSYAPCFFSLTLAN